MGHHGHHDHHHHHHDHHEPSSFNRAFAIAVIVNLSFTLVEAFYAIMANSMSLLADAGHNLGDVLSLILAWVANWLLSKPGSDKYSYGFKRTSILAAMINALLLVATCAVITYESILKLITPETVHELTVIIVALVGIVVNAGTAILFIRGSKDDLNIRGAFLHLASDALVSLGVAFAGTIILYTGWDWLDPITGILIVIIIMWSTWGLLKDSVNLLLDAVPRHIDYQAVVDYLKQVPGVSDVHDVHIWGLSTKQVAITAHLISPDMRVDDEVLHQINSDLKEQFKIHHGTFQIERGSDTHPCHTESSCL